MTHPDSHDADGGSEAAAGDSRFSPDALIRLRAGFELSRHPMLVSDDHRRWVTGNAAAAELLGIAPQEIPWHGMDEVMAVTPEQLEARWLTFLSTGFAEGLYDLEIPLRGRISVEYSATANIQPGRHLSIMMRPDDIVQAQTALPQEHWGPTEAAAGASQQHLTPREREILALIAVGVPSAEVAERLFVAPETVKSHVQNAMEKLGAHTRAHAVALALMTAQIEWDYSE